MSVSDSIDTRSASGRLVLNVLGSVAEWERQAISERTKEGLSAVKRQGYKFGTPPLGYRYAAELDEHGRKVWEVDAAQQRSLARLLELHDVGKSTPEIAEILNRESAPKNRPGSWNRIIVLRVLKRENRLAKVLRVQRGWRRLEEPAAHDATSCRSVILALRAQGLSLREICTALEKQRLSPPGGKRWHASSVAALLGYKRS